MEKHYDIKVSCPLPKKGSDSRQGLNLDRSIRKFRALTFRPLRRTVVYHKKSCIMLEHILNITATIIASYNII